MTNIQTSGIIVPSVTPFKDDGHIDFDAAENLTKMQMNAGAIGFYVGGSSGEGLLQSVSERKEFLSCIAGKAKEKLLMAQVGCMSLQDAIELSQYAAAAGYQYISSTPPFYFAYTAEDVQKYYMELAEASPLPLILYNIPATTGKALSLLAMEKLMDHPNIAGIKYTDTNMFALQQIISSRPEGLYYNGPDEMLLAGLSLGADGGIGSTYNVLTSHYVSLFEHFQNGHMKEVQKLQDKSNKYIRTLLEVSPTVIPGIKASLNILGYDVGLPRKPLQSLPTDKVRKLQQALQDFL